MTDHSSHESIDALRGLVGPVDTADDALPFVRALSRLGMRGAALLVVLDGDRHLLDVLAVVDGAEELSLLVELTWCYRDARALFLAVDRTGETPADRPDDELLWMELSDLAVAKGLCLRDLFVVWGTKTFSIAEFAPTPAQW